ncbi:MAG TPA: Hsp20/alpha crystallin family protein [Gaiellaceae bacterium]|jgi:HSP20 family protein|nr:Hsp20/alpha crystallin family protein [Gaiellaceae bacterium]
MAVVRWEPFRELAALQSEMGRWMNQVAGTGGGGNGQSSTWLPAVDVWETDDELVMSFDLPGMSEDKLAVELDDGVLTVTGERERSGEQSGDRFYRFERRFGTFTRSVTLPSGVSEDAIKADYKDGVLEVRVAKPEEPKPRRIQIGSSEQTTIEGTSSES